MIIRIAEIMNEVGLKNALPTSQIKVENQQDLQQLETQKLDS